VIVDAELCPVFAAADGGPLTDDAYVPVWAEDTATNNDADYDYDAFEYWDSRQIPLMAVDAGVVAFGSTFVDDRSLTGEYDNLAFYLNVLHAEVGSGTVVWDESNGQYWTLDEFTQFESAAESEGFDVRPTDNLYNDLSSADAAVVTAPGEYLTDGELDGLAEFVADGGTLILHDQSDYNDYDATQRLDEICARLGTVFQFNDDQVYDFPDNDGPYLTDAGGPVVDSANVTVTEEQPSQADFQVSGLTAPANVTVNGTFDVSATVTNAGNAAGTQTVEFQLDGSVVASQSLSLNASESDTVTFTGLSVSQTGTFTHGVFTADDSATANITVEAAAEGPGILPGQSAEATDPDGDGLYEDVNGDGVFNVIDVSVLLGIFDDVDAEDEQFLDFNEDGQINIVDVSVLLGQT